MSPLISGLASVASMIFNAASGGASKTAASRRTADAEVPQASALVTLSPQAEALARFAGKGIEATQGGLDAAVSAVSRSVGGAAGNAGAAALSGRSVSTQDFQELLTRFGADDAQKAQLTAGFDTNNDGAISRDEFLQGLAKTSSTQTATDFSQAVRQMLDGAGNADGVVAAKEFTAFTTAFVNAQQRGRSA